MENAHYEQCISRVATMFKTLFNNYSYIIGIIKIYFLMFSNSSAADLMYFETVYLGTLSIKVAGGSFIITYTQLQVLVVYLLEK